MNNQGREGLNILQCRKVLPGNTGIIREEKDGTHYM
jgi:hypothetical protein